MDLHPLDPRASPTRRIISAPGAAVDAIPFPVLGMDFDNGSEFINHGVVRWAGNLDLSCTVWGGFVFWVGFFVGMVPVVWSSWGTKPAVGSGG